jgi:hypothetical protein
MFFFLLGKTQRIVGPRFELFQFSVLWREIEIAMKIEMAREIEMEMGR